MPNPICLNCNRELERIRNGVKIKIDEHRAQYADELECPVCHTKILDDFGRIYYDPHPDTYDYKHPRFDR